MPNTPEQDQLEALLSHLSHGDIDKADLQDKAIARAKRQGMQVDEGSFYSEVLLFESRNLISRQYNINENKIEVCTFPNVDGGMLIIEGQSIENTEDFQYWSSGCGG